eukprot:jgi/Psemu1/221401/e_gw1.1120.3.1
MERYFDDEWKEDPKVVDSLLSQELMQLSMKERNAIQEEIHGVHCLAPEETPNMLQESLGKLAFELEHVLPLHKKKAFLESQQLNETYVNHDNFRLRILRCELFDASKAAKRLALFLHCVQDLFGDYALQRPVRLSDFTRDELKYMRRGRYQFLPFRDRSGRRILVTFPGKELETIPPRVKSKITLYLAWTAGDNVDTQQKGLVALVWFDRSFEVSNNPSKLHHKFHEVTTVRATSIHLCTPDTPFYRFRRAVLTMRIGHNRNKLRVHLGYPMELYYILQGYGISTDTIPITFSGTVKVAPVRQWMRVRQYFEEPYYQDSGESSSIVECPRLSDIVFRQGTNVCSHPGNAAFRALIATKYQDFWDTNSTKRNHKNNTRVFIKGVMDEIEKSQLRVLSWNDKQGCWKVLKDDSQIYMKIEYLVRELRAMNRARLNRQMITSSTLFFCDGGGGSRQNVQSPITFKRDDVADDSFGAGCFQGCFDTDSDKSPDK